MVKINWTQQSIDDLINIAEYIRNDSEKYAKLTVKRLKTRVSQLKYFPKSGRIVDELNDENIRELIDGNYRIIYKVVSPHQLDVLTVHHAARRLKID